MTTRIPGLLFEAVAEAPGGAPGGEPGGEPEPVEAPEPGGEPAAEPEPAEPAEPDYEALLSSPAGQEALRRAVEQMGVGLEDPYAGGYYEPEPEPTDPLAEFDFLADDAPQQLGRILEERDRRLFEAFSGSPAIAHAEEAHQKEWASSQFTSIEAELKASVPEPLRELAIGLAAGSRPPDGHPELGRFDPGRALYDATSTLHKLIQSERAAAIRDYQAGVSGEGGVPAEPSAAGVAAVHSEAVPQTMREAREKWERQQGFR